jgi:transcriptional regulator with XRE-family HTH domain
MVIGGKMIRANGPSIKAMGHVIRKRRKALGLTQQAFGDRVGLPKKAIARIETGGNCHVKDLWLIIDGLGLDWLRFFTEVDDLPF